MLSCKMNIQEFPDTLTLFIFSFLSETDLCRVAQTCKSWRLIAYDSSLWKSVNLKRFHNLNEICLMKVIRSRMVLLLYKLNLGGFTLPPRVFHVLVRHCPRLRVLCLESATFVEDFLDKASIAMSVSVQRFCTCYYTVCLLFYTILLPHTNSYTIPVTMLYPVWDWSKLLPPFSQPPN